MTHKWQPVDEAGNNPNYWNIRSATLDVPGGTLHRTVITRESVGSAPAMTVTFVPTPEPSKIVTIPDEVLRDLMSRKDVASGRSLLKKWLFAHGLELEA